MRGVTEKESAFLDEYVADPERQGYAVHLPQRDTDQTDTHGYTICCTNRQALLDAEEVHTYWNPSSRGSGFDLGTYFAAEKPRGCKKFVLINKDNVQPTNHKSFENVVLELHERSERA